MNTASKTLLVILCILFFISCGRTEIKTLYINKIDQPIVIDANMERSWDICDWEPVSNIRFSRNKTIDPKDLEANFKSTWDSEYLYFLISVEDDKKFVLHADSEIEKAYDLRIQELDGIALYFDNGLKEKAENNITYFRLTYGTDTISLQGRDLTTVAPYNEIKSSYKEHDNGYLYECKIPWKLLGVDPSKDQSIRFEMNVVDNDGDVIMPGALAKKKTIKTWADKTGTNPAWDNSVYGRIIFNTN